MTSILRSPLLSFLALLNVLVASLLGALLFLYDDRALQEPETARQIEIPAITYEERTQQNYPHPSVNEHPVFHRSRKPYVAPAAPVVPAPQQDPGAALSHYKLKGIIFRPDNRGVAYLLDIRSSQEHKLRLNDYVEGWSVIQISRSDVTLGLGNKRRTLSLLAADQ